MWYVCDVPDAVVYVLVNCFIVCGCAVSRKYMNVCDSVGNMYLHHLKLYVVSINGRMYVCCIRCYVVFNESDESTSWGPTEGACSMAVPAMSTLSRTSALPMPSTHLNPSEETGTGCQVTSKYGRTPPNKHGGVGREQQRPTRCQQSPSVLNYPQLVKMTPHWYSNL